MTFVNVIADKPRDLIGCVAFNFSWLSAYIAIAWYTTSAILSYRCAALCSDGTAAPIEAATIERLHLVGTVFFAVAVVASSFAIFDHYFYPSLLSAFALCGFLMLFLGERRRAPGFKWGSLLG